MNYISNHTILASIKDSEDFLLMNFLSQQADVLSKEKAEEWKSGKFSEEVEYKEKAYLTTEKEEQKLFKLKYLDFIDQRDKDELQLFFVPNYACNFACKYCYQDEYSHPQLSERKAIAEAFFSYVDLEFRNRKKYITVFGGEPLLDNPSQKELIQFLVDKCLENKLDMAFVTNGYSLVSYIDVLKNAPIREIQVTLDGVGVAHDSRRFLHGGGQTFEQIVKGIDLLLENQIAVNLRMVVDKENIEQLPVLAKFAIEKGWTKSPFFKTQLGRNYELHHCQEQNERLFTRIGLYEKIYELLKEHPYISEFHKPAFSISKYLYENGEMPDPLFDSCPGCKTEWAFDFSGKIYSCTATVGKAGEELGTFYPEVSINKKIVSEWEDRDITSIPECKDCSVRLACGGGCASVAKNRTGKVLSPDCRPIKELLSLGVGHYFKDEI